MQNSAKPAFMLLSSVALAACGGAGGTGDTSNAPPQATTGTYQTLNSRAAVTSTLGGVAVRGNATRNTTDIASVSGTLTHNTGRTVVSDGTLRLTDPNGPNAQGELSDGTNTVELVDVPGFEYVQAYTADYQQGGTRFETFGLSGVVTAPSDMPNRGVATYRGFGGVFLRDGGGTTHDGNSSNTTVTADFAAGRVNVDMQGVTGDAATVGRFDRIQINNMVVSGNQFSGGTQNYSSNGNAAAPIGLAVSAQLAQGAFFGSDPANGVPDEVGGVFVASGSSGFLGGTFVAD